MRRLIELISMAYHEIRLLLGKTLFNFDIQLKEESKNWDDQKIFILWAKGELNCTLTPAVHNNSRTNVVE
jgi:hypothetical protein